MRKINCFEEVDTKYKAILRIAGHIVYMTCDEVSKELLKQKKNSGNFNMDGDYEDTNRNKLMEWIIETISKDTPNEAVKVELLSSIQQSQRSNKETVLEFVGRYKGAVNSYVNQTAEIAEFSSCQFAIIMLCNVWLSSNTSNTVPFQIVKNGKQVFRNTYEHWDIIIRKEGRVNWKGYDRRGATSGLI